jgi:hypothetical protein
VRELQTEVEIAAPAERVWQLLTDFQGYPQWNPFILSIAGVAEPGTRLAVNIQPPGGKAMTFRPVVLQATAPRELRWMGRLLVPGLFDGEHAFRIERLDGQRIRFVQHERFSGLLVPALWRRVGTDTERGFNAMNAALKRVAEQQ